MTDPAHLEHLMQTTHASAHRNFGSKLDKRELGLGERLITLVTTAPEGDFRDWGPIRAGAHESAGALRVPAAVGVQGAQNGAYLSRRHARRRTIIALEKVPM